MKTKAIFLLLCTSVLVIMVGCSPSITGNVQDVISGEHEHAHEHTHGVVEAPNLESGKIGIETVELMDASISNEDKNLIDDILNEIDEATEEAITDVWISEYHKNNLGSWIIVRNYSELSEAEQNQIMYKIGRDATLNEQKRTVKRIDFDNITLFTTSTELAEKMAPYVEYIKTTGANISFNTIEKCLVIMEKS